MKLWLFTLLLVTGLSSAFAMDPVVHDTLYFSYQKQILSGNAKSFTGFSKVEQKVFVDAIWDLAQENSPQALKALDSLDPLFYDLIERLRLGILRLKYKRATTLPEDLVTDVMNALKDPQADIKLVYTLAAYEEDILAAGQKQIIDLAKTHPQYFDIANDGERKKEYSEDELTELFYKTPDVTTYMNGEYIKAVKIFMFCRSNRLYPCLMTMKNIHGEAVRNADGSLWTHKALASSKYGLPSYSHNGNTPSGIHTIDSVMPDLDQSISFGKFRRMILNFVPKSKDEKLIRSLLPESSQDKDWWKASIRSRDIGRSDLRIHGTGKINPDPTVPYYPFMRTSGCIAQRENTYDGVTYTDQKDLLEAIQRAMDLEPSIDNELKIKGILYLYEIDDVNEPVTLQALNNKGIE